MSDPATLGLVISVAASVASQLLGPKQPGISSTGPRVGDTGVSSSAYGETIPVNYGTVRVGGNVIWSPGLREVRRTVESEQGKGGGATSTSTTFRYFLDAAVGIGAGPLSKVTRIWANSKLIYDARPGSKTFFKYRTAKIRVYTGTEDQMPDPLMEAEEGVGNVPAYAGLAYVVVENLPLRDFGNGMPQFTFEAAWTGSDEFPKTLLWGNPGSTGDFQGINPNWLDIWPHVLDAQNEVLWAGGGVPVTWSRIDLKAGHIVNQRSMSAGPAGSDLLTNLELPGARSGSVVEGPWLLFVARENPPGGANRSIFRVDKRTFKVVAKTAGVANFNALQMVLFDSLSPLELEPEPAVFGIDTGFAFMLPAEFDDGALLSFQTNAEVDGLPSGAGLNYIAGPDAGGAFWVSANQGANFVGLVRYRVFSGAVSAGGRFGAGVGARYFQEPIGDAVFDIYDGVFGGGTGGLPQVAGMLLDQDTQQLILAVASNALGGYMAKWDIATESIVESVSIAALGADSDFFSFVTNGSLGAGMASLRNQPATKSFYMNAGSSRVYKFEWDSPNGVAGTGFRLEKIDLSALYGLGINTTASHLLTLVAANSLVIRSTSPSGVYRVDLDRVAAGVGDLEDVVTDLCVRSGVSASLVDATALSGISVRGVELSRRGASRDMLDRLSIAYLYDFVESDNGVKFVLRGGASVATVDADDLGAALERLPDSPVRLEERTLQEDEVPFQVDVKFTDVDRDYQAGTTIAKRHKQPGASVASEEPQRLELPVVFSAQEAARTADVQLGVSWIGREKQAGALPPAFLSLEPSDVVTVTREGEPDLLVRLDELEFGGGLVVGFKSSAEDPDVYDSAVEGSSGSGLVEAGFDVPGSVQLRVLDLPLLRDSHARADLTGPYFGVELEAGDFRGATVHQSLDQLSWVQVAALPDYVRGFAVLTSAAALPEHLWYQTDYATSLTVVPLNEASADALESITDAQLLTERNVAVWGSPSGGWEVVKFRDATDNGDGTWTLGGAWIRARRGTGRVAVNGHPAGDTLLLMNPNQQSDSWYRNTYEVGTLGQTRFLRATPLSHPFEAVEFSSFTVTGTDLKPYEVVHVSSQRGVPTANAVRLTWIRQTRVGGTADWADGVTAPNLAETIERYEVVLLGGPAHASPGSEALSKTYNNQVTTSGNDFSAAEQAAAGYALADALQFVIYQHSATVGRGFPRTVTVPGV